jgi:hypothetical protein
VVTVVSVTTVVESTDGIVALLVSLELQETANMVAITIAAKIVFLIFLRFYLFLIFKIFGQPRLIMGGTYPSFHLFMSTS